MPFFIMTCRHHVGTAEKREANRASHRRWVDTGGDGLVSVLIGSAIVDDQQHNVGHFGILEAESQANALAFAEGDAFFKAGIVASVEIIPLASKFQADRISQPMSPRL